MTEWKGEYMGGARYHQIRWTERRDDDEDDWCNFEGPDGERFEFEGQLPLNDDEKATFRILQLVICRQDRKRERFPGASETNESETKAKAADPTGGHGQTQPKPHAPAQWIE